MLLWGQVADATQCSAAQHPRIPMLIAIAAYLNSVTRSEPDETSWIAGQVFVSNFDFVNIVKCL